MFFSFSGCFTSCSFLFPYLHFSGCWMPLAPFKHSLDCSLRQRSIGLCQASIQEAHSYRTESCRLWVSTHLLSDMAPSVFNWGPQMPALACSTLRKRKKKSSLCCCLEFHIVQLHSWISCIEASKTLMTQVRLTENLKKRGGRYNFPWTVLLKSFCL